MKVETLRRKKTSPPIHRERENSNSKTLFYKDCSLGSVKNPTTSPTDKQISRERERERKREREREREREHKIGKPKR